MLVVESTYFLDLDFLFACVRYFVEKLKNINALSNIDTAL